MVILSKACKRDNFELHNSLNLSFTNIWGLHLNFVDCESFLESNSPDILALCEANLDDSIDSGNFSVRDYLPLIQKDCSTRTSFCTELISRKLSVCTELISRKLCRFLSMFSTDFTSLSVSLLFSPSITFFSFVHSFWFYFIWHRWGSPHQPICCFCLWRL